MGRWCRNRGKNLQEMLQTPEAFELLSGLDPSSSSSSLIAEIMKRKNQVS